MIRKVRTEIKHFFMPTVTFCVEGISTIILNKLVDFKLRNIRISESDDTVTFSAPLLYKKQIERILANQTFIVRKHRNLLDTISFFHGNVLFISVMLCMIIALIVLDGLVFRIRIEGVESYERAQIISFLNDQGIRPFSWKRSVPQQTANVLTQQFDFIAHSNMSIHGSALVFSIYRTQVPPGASRSDLVATRDAIITSVTVLSGIPMVNVGDIVHQGQVLIKAAFQIGVEVGEPDEHGRPTYTPITQPGIAIAHVRGEVTFTLSAITSDVAQSNAIANDLYLKLLSNYGFDDTDTREVFTNPLEDGTYSIEVVIRRNMLLHT